MAISAAILPQGVRPMAALIDATSGCLPPSGARNFGITWVTVIAAASIKIMPHRFAVWGRRSSACRATIKAVPMRAVATIINAMLSLANQMTTALRPPAAARSSACCHEYDLVNQCTINKTKINMPTMNNWSLSNWVVWSKNDGQSATTAVAAMPTPRPKTSRVRLKTRIRMAR